jgi:hypothetical protein
MSSTHGKCSLYLCPEQPDFTVTNLPTLVTALQEIGLISQKINQQDSNNHYSSGDRYLEYIAYMGCAPTIQFEASENNENFCFIKIHQFDSAQLIYSQKQARAPHCPNCKKPVKNWASNKTQSQIMCDQCSTTSNIEEFNWRKMAGYARLFIEITDVFPKETIPQQLLLDKLSNISKTEWLYFYTCY